jgi:hypothetical protein
VRAEIMDALGVMTLQSFRSHMNGKILHNDAEIARIDAIFRKYGITDVWGHRSRTAIKEQEEMS